MVKSLLFRFPRYLKIHKYFPAIIAHLKFPYNIDWINEDLGEISRWSLNMYLFLESLFGETDIVI